MAAKVRCFTCNVFVFVVFVVFVVVDLMSVTTVVFYSSVNCACCCCCLFRFCYEVHVVTGVLAGATVSFHYCYRPICVTVISVLLLAMLMTPSCSYVRIAYNAVVVVVVVVVVVFVLIVMSVSMCWC